MEPTVKTNRLAIVGSHPATRELAPYENGLYEIWLLNESPMKPEVYKRWDASLQIHRPEIYTSLTNWVNKDHWAWLQQDHGEGTFGRKRIFMEEVDPRVPNSVKYPLEGVLGMIPYHYLRSSPAMALALGIYLGYKQIALYGSELSSGTEYAYQATNLAFWIGFAHGKGVELDLQCWHSEFNQPIYGYEGEAQIDREFFQARAVENDKGWQANEKTLRKVKDALSEALLKHNYDKAGPLTAELMMVAQTTGETAGALSEAERYAKREDEISRQEFERKSAQAQIDGEKMREKMWHAAGRVEYMWNVWRTSGKMEALTQLRVFVEEQARLAYDTGAMVGIFGENMLYLKKYDELVTALGGKRALHQLGKEG